MGFMLLGRMREAWLSFVHLHKNQRPEQTTRSGSFQAARVTRNSTWHLTSP